MDDDESLVKQTDEMRSLMAMAIDDGFAFASSTTIGNKTVLRMCTNNPRTTLELIYEKTITLMGRLAAELEEQVQTRSRQPVSARRAALIMYSLYRES